MAHTLGKQRWLVPLLGLVGLMATALPARADDSVEVTVVAVLATEQNDKVDPRLCWVAQEVQKKRPKLTGFRVGILTRKRLDIGVKETFPLTDGQKATIVIRHGPDKQGCIEVTVKAPKGGELTYSTACEKYVLVGTECQTKDKETLIVAVKVKCCKGKK
jgi:hypothetical protein